MHAAEAALSSYICYTNYTISIKGHYMITYRTDNLLFVPPYIFDALARRWRHKNSTTKIPIYHMLGKSYRLIPFKSKKLLPITSNVLAYQIHM